MTSAKINFLKAGFHRIDTIAKRSSPRLVSIESMQVTIEISSAALRMCCNILPYKEKKICKIRRRFLTKDRQVCKFCNFRKAIAQGLKGYFRDPGFGQNTVRGSGKRKIS